MYQSLEGIFLGVFKMPTSLWGQRSTKIAKTPNNQYCKIINKLWWEVNVISIVEHHGRGFFPKLSAFRLRNYQYGRVSQGSYKSLSWHILNLSTLICRRSSIKIPLNIDEVHKQLQKTGDIATKVGSKEIRLFFFPLGVKSWCIKKKA